MSQNLFDVAMPHHQAGRLAQAERLYRQILASDPNHVDATHYLGVIAHQAGRNDIAAELIRRAWWFARDIEAAYRQMWHRWCKSAVGNLR